MLTKMSIKSLQTILLHTAMQNTLASIFCFTSLKSTCLWYHKPLYIQVRWPPMKVKEASGWSQEKSDVHILFTAILLDRKLINVGQQDASVGCIACNAKITTNLKKKNLYDSASSPISDSGPWHRSFTKPAKVPYETYAPSGPHSARSFKPYAKFPDFKRSLSSCCFHTPQWLCSVWPENVNENISILVHLLGTRFNLHLQVIVSAKLVAAIPNCCL